MGSKAVKYLAKKFKFFPKLTKLILCGCDPGDMGAAAIAKYLKGLVEIKIMDLSLVTDIGPSTNKTINAFGLDKLAQAFKNHPSLESVNVRGHNIEGKKFLDNLMNKQGKKLS